MPLANQLLAKELILLGFQARQKPSHYYTNLLYFHADDVTTATCFDVLSD
jgi:hypothetical protein